MRVWESGVGDLGGCKVEGFRVSRSGFKDEGFGIEDEDRVYDVVSRVWGL